MTTRITTLLLCACSFLVLGCEADEDGSFSITNADFAGSSVPTGSGQGPTGEPVFDTIVENPFVVVQEEPISTFSIDADGGSYAVTRRLIREGNSGLDAYRPAIRSEEFVNYLPLGYDFNEPSHPIDLDGEVVQCPWAPSHKLIRIGIVGEPIAEADLPASNYVFLIDVSGSMGTAGKLDLLKQGFSALVTTFDANDRVAIVTYSGNTAVALGSTRGDQHSRILAVLNGLTTGGGTNGGQGILDAYSLAEEGFIEGGNNRLILATDGDFNVGITDRDELIALIEREREKGVFLTTVGVGLGNYNEALMEQVANKGNGTYEYVGDAQDIQKVFVHERSKLIAVAKDVKVQVEFDPNFVEQYRLIGYENRVLSTEDFTDDTRDAGEIGAGQSVTALYEIVPTEVGSRASQSSVTTPFTIDFRYKRPDADESVPMVLTVSDDGRSLEQATDQTRLATSAAAFALVLRRSAFIGNTTLADVSQWANLAISIPDDHGYIADFRALIEEAR